MPENREPVWENSHAILRGKTAKMVFGAMSLVALLLSVQNNAATRFFTWPYIFYGQCLLLFPTLAFGLLWASRGSCLCKLEFAALAFSTATVGLSTGLSNHPLISFESSLFYLFGISLCILTSEFLRRHALIESDSWTLKAARILGVAITFPVVASMIGWANYLSDIAPYQGGLRNVFRSAILFRNPQPFGHWNYTGGYALLALPWLITLALFDKSKWRLIWWLPVMLGSIMLFSASSRGALLGVIAALVCLFVVGLYTGRLRAKNALWAASILLIAGFVLTMTNPRLRILVFSPSTLLQPNEGDIQRIAMLKGGALLFQQKPWTGHGPGMTPFVYPSVRRGLPGGVETALQLHNTPLQLAVDLGILGIAGASLFTFLLMRKTKAWLAAPPSIARAFSLTAAITLAGYLVMALTDYQLNVIAITTLVALLAGLVLSIPSLRTTQRQMKSAGLAIAILALSGGATLIPSWRSRASYWSAWGNSQTTANLQDLEEAVIHSPRNPYYLNQLAIQTAEAALSEKSAKQSAALKERACLLLDRSLEIDPLQEPALASLGWLYLAEQPDKAETYFCRAIELLPDRDTLHFGLALSALAQNKIEKAVGELARECLVNPFFLASPLWNQEPFQSLRPACIRQLQRFYQLCISHPKASRWQLKQWSTALAFTLWWLDEGPAPTGMLLDGATASQQEFFSWLEHEGTELPDSNASWIVLEHARRNPVQAEAILKSSHLRFGPASIAGASRRLAAKPDSITRLLKSPAPDNVGVVQQKINRGHYAVIFGYLDGPGFDDLAPRFVDDFLQTFSAPLFPPRCNVPGPILNQLQTAP